MLSTSTKVAFGYVLLVALLLGAIRYIYRQMTLLTEPAGVEEVVNSRRHTTHHLVSKLYEAEIIGQTLQMGRLNEYPRYQRAMKEAGVTVDSLRIQFTDTLQQARLDTVSMLLRSKERNMRLVLAALGQSPTDELYRQQLDSLISQQDSVLRNATHLQRRVVTHQNTYTIRHKRKPFFERVRDVFAPGKSDSTLVNNVVEEVYTDTIDEIFNPVDTIANMLTGIHDRVYQTRQEHRRTLENRLHRLHIAGSNLGKRVNQLLESIEQDELAAARKRLEQEQAIRQRAAQAIGIIATLAVVLVLVFFIVVWRDLTRSNHYRRELEKSKQYAENLLKAREKLMLTITHDIKAPAGSIIGYIDLLVRLVKDKRQLFYLSNMKSSARHLLELVTSLLDYHRLEAGKMDLHPVVFNPRQLFADIYNGFLPLAGNKGLELHLEDNLPSSLILEGDSFRIRQIAENLLSNALKFTSSGRITLSFGYQDGAFKFCVIDTGCGMTPQEQERIFQEFTRLSSAQGQEGFGLGLSITRKLVELLQGSISVESRPGQGSAFFVSLPVPVSAASVAADEESGHGTVAVKRALRILLIDDDRIQMNLTEALLNSVLAPRTPQGMTCRPEIFCCTRPEEVFELLRSHTFDIVFTDIQMPAMNGFELLQNLRYMNLPQARRVPVVAITARGDLDEADFLAKGFAGMLQKPFNRSDLQRVLTEALHTETDLPAGETASAEAVPVGGTYNWASLTAFSADDPDAQREIIRTFASETEKNLLRMKQAMEGRDMETLCAVAHKMLPTFVMIEAQEAVAALRWLEERRGETTLSEEAEEKARQAVAGAEKVLSDLPVV